MNQLSVRASRRAAQKGPVSLTLAREIALGVVRAQPRLPETRLPLSLACDRILTDEVTAPCDLPRFDTAAIDGFAVARADLIGNGPWQLKVGDRLRAGEGREMTCLAEPRVAIEIAGGAKVPTDLDAVVGREGACAEGGYVTVHHRPASAENIRRTAETATKGKHLIPPRTVLDARHLGLMAALGIANAPVSRKLPVALMSIGSELVEVGSRLCDAQIHDAARPILLSALSEKWISVRDLGIVRDCSEMLRLVLEEAVACHRIVLTTGRPDLVAGVIADLDGKVLLQGIAMAPGQSTVIGTKGGALIIGLSSDPVAAWIGLHAIVKDVLRAAAALPGSAHALRQGFAQFSFATGPGRTELPLVRRAGLDAQGNEMLELSRETKDANLCQLARSDGFAVISGDGATLLPGSPVHWIATN